MNILRFNHVAPSLFHYCNDPEDRFWLGRRPKRAVSSPVNQQISGLHLCYVRGDWPVFWRVGQRDNDVLVDEDEEGQQEAQAHGAEDVQGRQALKRSHVEGGPVVNFEDWNCGHKHKSLGLTLFQLFRHLGPKRDGDLVKQNQTAQELYLFEI